MIKLVDLLKEDKLSTILWLDDLRDPKDHIQGDNIHWVKNYKQFIKWIELNGLPDIISFDHDLGGEKSRTGADALRWMLNFIIDNNLNLPHIKLHTANPIGRQNMESLINSYKKIYNKDESLNEFFFFFSDDNWDKEVKEVISKYENLLKTIPND